MAKPAEDAEIEVPGGGRPVDTAAALAIGMRKSQSAPRPDPELDAFLDEQMRLVRLQTEHLHERREMQLVHLRARRWNQFEIASGLDLSRPERAALNVLMHRTARGPLGG